MGGGVGCHPRRPRRAPRALFTLNFFAVLYIKGSWERATSIWAHEKAIWRLGKLWLGRAGLSASLIPHSLQGAESGVLASPGCADKEFITLFLHNFTSLWINVKLFVVTRVRLQHLWRMKERVSVEQTPNSQFTFIQITVHFHINQSSYFF